MQADAEALSSADPALADRYQAVRATTVALCAPLSPEDCCAQSMADASPAKWHLAHTSWFFETLVVAPETADYRPLDPRYRILFNSYYNTVGAQHPRPERGLLTRPSLAEVLAYRRHVDAHVLALLARGVDPAVADTVRLGIEHEQQHQELLLTDVKHLLSCNPLHPAYRSVAEPLARGATPLGWLRHAGGLQRVGHGGEGFAFDNERPRHQVLLQPFELATRPVTNGELLAFIDDGGYRRPELWLSDGWATVEAAGWDAPAYWSRDGGAWLTHTLGGLRAVQEAEPVCHVSYYEADAYARWASARLPTEAEWEVAAAARPVDGNLLESGRLHPAAAPVVGDGGLAQLFGDVWEWTQSAYAPYPGYQPPRGALGEYNGKFMCSQLVLRGGSCATPRAHVRATYRNFFYPHQRWQFSGLRLARDGAP
jgi:ergothioneine biosynthesis protein EgtB